MAPAYLFSAEGGKMLSEKRHILMSAVTFSANGPSMQFFTKWKTMPMVNNMKTGPAILLWKILHHHLRFHSVCKLHVDLRYSKGFQKLLRSSQNTGKMYTIKSHKIFWKDSVVEQNLTHPKDNFWSYLNRWCEIVVICHDRTTANMDPCCTYFKHC